MEAFFVKFLLCLFIIVFMSSSVMAERRENKNGYSARVHGTKNNTKDECNPEVGTGIRRILIRVYNNPNQQCYRQFFVPQQGQGRPPVGLRQPNNHDIRYICQPPDQQTYYATMFDAAKGIAVFSAYKLTQATAHFPGNQANVGFCPTPGIQRQGRDDLYKNQGYEPKYEKGHLAPAHTFSQNQERYASTFTYTNAVPQCQSFNGGPWKTFENKIRLYAHNCTQGQGTLYLLTGTSFSGAFEPNNFPQANHAQINLLSQNPQVWIPVSMWTAGCCVRPNNLNQPTESFAVIGNNLQNEGDEAEWLLEQSESEDEDLSNTQQVTVANLQTFLRNDAIRNHFTNGGQDHAPNVNLFPGNPDCLTDTQLNLEFMK